jgi:hypothetical protein
MTDSMARKMKAGALERIIEEAIGVDLAPCRKRLERASDYPKAVVL